MKKIDLNTLICLCVPVLVLIAIGSTSPATGFAMIMKGSWLLVVQTVSALVGLLWSAFCWAMPFISAGLVSLFIFKIKVKESADLADYACAAVAGVSALALSMHQGAAGSLPLIAGSLVALSFYHDAKLKAGKNTATKAGLIIFVFLFSVFFTLGQFVGVIEQDLSDQHKQTSLINQL